MISYLRGGGWGKKKKNKTRMGDRVEWKKVKITDKERVRTREIQKEKVTGNLMIMTQQLSKPIFLSKVT